MVSRAWDEVVSERLYEGVDEGMDERWDKGWDGGQQQKTKQHCCLWSVT